MGSHEPVLILGADTTFGLATVQLAHAMGQRVIAVADNEHRKIVEEYGADKVFDRTSNELAQKIRDATQNDLRRTVVTTLMVRPAQVLRRCSQRLTLLPLSLSLAGQRPRGCHQLDAHRRGDQREPVDDGPV